MNNPLEFFFKLGEKVTKGDIKRKVDFDYYMLWVIFFAFLGIFVGNLIDFVKYQKLSNLGWAFFGMAIMWFQYFGLKQMYDYRKLINLPKEEMKVEPVEEMLKSFNNESNKVSEVREDNK